MIIQLIKSTSVCGFLLFVFSLSNMLSSQRGKEKKNKEIPKRCLETKTVTHHS
jgi:hypothetical protein